MSKSDIANLRSALRSFGVLGLLGGVLARVAFAKVPFLLALGLPPVESMTLGVGVGWALGGIVRCPTLVFYSSLIQIRLQVWLNWMNEGSANDKMQRLQDEHFVGHLPANAATPRRRSSRAGATATQANRARNRNLRAGRTSGSIERPPQVASLRISDHRVSSALVAQEPGPS